MKKFLPALIFLLLASPVLAQNPAVIVLEGPVTPVANCTVQRNAGNTAWSCTAPAGASQPLTDGSGLIADNADPTKVLFFQLSGLTTATNRTWTIPDANITIPSTIASLAANTFTALQTMNGGLATTTGTFSSTLAVTGATTLSSTLAVTGAATFSSAAQVANGQKLTLDGATGQTYIYRYSDVVLDFYVNNASAMRLYPGGSTSTSYIDSTLQTRIIQAIGEPVSVTANNSAYLAYDTPNTAATFGATASGANHRGLNFKVLNAGTATIAMSMPYTGELELKSTLGMIKQYEGADFWGVYHNTDQTLRWNYNNAGNDEVTLSTGGLLFALGGVTTSGTLNVSGDTQQILLNSSDYNIVTLANAGSGAALDEGLVGVKKDGTYKAYMYASTTAVFYGLTWPTTASAANAYVADGGNLSRSTSSARYKTDIETITLADAQRTVLGLRAVTYKGIGPDDRPLPFAGLIAEEVVTVNPLLVTFDKDGTTPNYVTYDRVAAYMLPVVQDHETRIAELEALLKLPAKQRGNLNALDAKRNADLATYRAWEKSHKSQGTQVTERLTAQDVEREKTRLVDKAKADADLKAAQQRQVIRTRLSACDADNVIIEQQGGTRQVCSVTDAEKVERKAMQEEAKAANDKAAADAAEQKKQELARCAALNAKIKAAGGKELVCGSTAPINQEERIR